MKTKSVECCWRKEDGFAPNSDVDDGENIVEETQLRKKRRVIHA